MRTMRTMLRPARRGTFLICNGCSASSQNAQFAYNSTLITGYGKAYITPTASQLPAILLEIQRAIPVALVQ